MNRFVEKALLHLTGTSDINMIPREQLEHLCNEYPYFSVARVLLSKKLKLQQDDGFLPQVQKTALYFTNPHWLHYQLMNEEPEIGLQTNDPDDNATPVSEQKEESRKIYEQLRSATKRKPDTTTANVDAANGSPVQISKEQRVENANGQPGEAAALENIIEVDNKYAGDGINGNDVAAGGRKEIVSAMPGEEVPVNPVELVTLPTEEPGTTDKTTEETIMPDELHPEMEEVLEDIDQQEADKQTLKETSGAGHSTEKTIPDTEPATSITTDKTAEETVMPDELHPEMEEVLEDIEQQEADKQTLKETSGAGHSTEKTIPDTEPATSIATEETVMPDELHPEMEEVLEDIDQQEADKQTSRETSGAGHSTEKTTPDAAITTEPQPATGENGLSTPAPENTAPHTAEKQEPLIAVEPYFTVDYFASQGIKLLIEKYPKDKLSQQLRSFTDWLKYMKKIGPENSLPTTEEVQMESTIQKIADSSNIPRDIITETMAEVLEKQGKKDQAIQLYMKLSFLDPGKSAYFAAKIQRLKGI